MRSCPRCASANEDAAQWCSSCERFLGRQEHAVAVGAPAHAPVHTPERASVAPPEPEPASPVVPAPQEQPAAPVAGSGGGVVRRRPDEEPEPEAVTRPARPERHRRLAPGERLCPACLTINEPLRTLCDGCGERLAGTGERPSSWWSRAVRAARARRSRTVALADAGRRPPVRRHRLRRVLRRCLALLAVLGLLGAGASLTGPLRPQVVAAVHTVQDLTRPPLNVHARSATAEASLPGHPAAHAVDGNTATFWASTPGQESPSLTLVLDEPTHLVGVGVHAGVSTQTDEFLASSRPVRVRFQYERDGAAPGTSKLYLLDDVPGFQRLDLDVRDMTVLRLVVVEDRGAHATSGAGAVSEVELFARRR